MRPRVADDIRKLREEIERHNRLYYVAANPEISDAAYDDMLQKLRKLEEDNPMFFDPNSPTQKVGGATVDYLVSIPHKVPMFSIDISPTIEDLTAWHNRNRSTLAEVWTGDLRYSVEWKVDGCALSVRYEHGFMTLATTRGDGVEGDDVTHNARTISNLPMHLTLPSIVGVPSYLDIRGEVCITHADFVRFQTEETAAGRENPSNPRNTASGAMRLLDPTECARRPLRFFAYAIGDVGPIGAGHSKHGESQQVLTNLGIPVVPGGGHNLLFEDALVYIEDLISVLPSVPFPIDGIVIKVEDKAAQAVIGNDTKYAKWQRAYKWRRLEGVTKLLDIEVQIGKSGALTPVAILEPVEIGEDVKTTIAKASIYNADEIERLDLRIGDTVIVEKAGEIIPRIVRVDTSEREPTAEPFIFPRRCPTCGHAAVRDENEGENGVIIRCSNSTSCPAQLHATLCAFASKRCMDIRQCGPKMVQSLMDAGLLQNVADFYDLPQKREELLKIPKMGEKKASLLIESIHETKMRPLENLLAGLNIRNLGVTAAQALVERYGTLLAIMAATEAQLCEIDGIGPTVARELRRFVNAEGNLVLLNRLLHAGVNAGTPVTEGLRQTGALAGKTVVITGQLVNYEREQARDAVRNAGGRSTGSVSKKTSFIVVGRDPGLKKLEKARELGIETIEEDEFMARLGVSDE